MLFEIKHRVLPEEVDAFKVVHFSNYFKWSSVAFIEYFHESGLGLGIFEEGKIEIRVGRVNAVYIASARLNDVVAIQSKDIIVHRNSITLKILMKIGEKIIHRSKLTIAFVDSATSRLVKTPEEIQILVLQPNQ